MWDIVKCIACKWRENTKRKQHNLVVRVEMYTALHNGLIFAIAFLQFTHIVTLENKCENL